VILPVPASSSVPAMILAMLYRNPDAVI